MDRLADWIENGETQCEFHSIDALSHPRGEWALRVWQQRPADGLRIGRDIPSRSVARLLSCVIVYEPSEDGRDFIVHLAGTGIRRRFPYEITGRRMSELFAVEQDFEMRFQNVKAVIAQNEPRMACIIHHVRNLEVLKLELLALPVVAPNGIDRWALTFALYF